jgi:hypothetical protein
MKGPLLLLLLLLLLLAQQTEPHQQQQQQQQLNSFSQLLSQQSRTCPANTITTTTTTTNNNNNQKQQQPPPKLKLKLLSFSEWKQQSNHQPVDENPVHKNLSADRTPSTWSTALRQSLAEIQKRATDYHLKPTTPLTCQPLEHSDQTSLNKNLSETHQEQKIIIKLTQHPPILYQPDPNTGTGNPDDPLKTLSTRTNYASFDCSASIHRSSKHTKSPSSILNEKKDKYLLTPCTTQKKNKDTNNFVVFELCDEIEIDHVVLANFEFFSSMFKLIKMSVSNSGLEGVGRAEWVDVGFLKTHNTRGFQVERTDC